MKTTIDLPEEMLHRAKIVAAQRKTTLKDMVVAGLNWAIHTPPEEPDHQSALRRVRKGLRLSGQPLTRGEVHERH